MHGFKEIVASTWTKNVQAQDPIRRVHIKLSRVAKALKIWQRDCVGDLRTQIATAKEIIWRLDQAEEARILSDEERALRTQLKSSYLGLLAIQKMNVEAKIEAHVDPAGRREFKTFPLQSKRPSPQGPHPGSQHRFGSSYHQGGQGRGASCSLQKHPGH
jgi:hypothetical protein